MYIIIVGGGHVGATLSEALLEMGHEVLVLERSRERAELLKEALGSVVMRGDGCEAAVLASAGAERADLFIAVTGEDEDNLVACQVAHHRFHVARTIALVNDPKNEALFKLLGINVTVDAASALVSGILHAVPGKHVSRLATFRDGALALFGIQVPETASCVGQPLGEVPLPEGTVVAAVVPLEGGPAVAAPERTLAPYDEVVALAAPEQEGALVAALTH